MPRRRTDTGWVPKLRPHTDRNGKVRARVRLNGQDHYCGTWGTPEAEAVYHRLIAEWLANNSQPLPRPQADSTVDEMLAGFLAHAQQEYRKHGRPTSEWYCFQSAAGPLSRLYGDTKAVAFGPRQLHNVRDAFLLERTRTGAPWTRGYVNEQVNRVRRIWTWGVEHGYVPLATVQLLATVKGLRRTKTTAPEGRKVRLVSWSLVEATLPYLRPVLRMLVQVHRLLGCRASEACILRPVDIDLHADPGSGDWLYSPYTWKTEHCEVRPEGQTYWVGPAARVILDPLIAAAPCPEAWLFPTSGFRGTRQGKGRYTKDSYGLAVRRVCRRHGLPEWSPGQIRHLRLTEVKLAEHAAGRNGEEGAQAVGGHREPSSTAHYTEQSELARRIMHLIG